MLPSRRRCSDALEGPAAEGDPLTRRLALVAAAATALLAAAIVTDVPSLLRGPAPYPPEWQWLRREGPISGAFLLALASIALLMILVLATASPAAVRHPGGAARATLAGAFALGLSLSFGLLALEPEGTFDTVFSRVVYRTATSYYTVAVSPEADDPVDFVRNHHLLLPGLRKAAKHAATHPPGPVLYYRALLAAFERAPAASRGLLRVTGVREENPRRAMAHHEPAARATALAGGLGLIVAAALTVWPVAALAGALGASPLAAARIGALWVVVPGPVLMAPMLDQGLALPVAVAAAALARAMGSTDDAVATRASVWAGLAGGLAAWLSYGAAVFLAIAGLAAMAFGAARGRGLRMSAPRAALAAAVSLVVFTAPALLGHHPFEAARIALGIHREVYTAPRSYALWLVFNLVDLAVFLGVPLATLLVARLVRAARGGTMAPSLAYALGSVAGLALLVLSGATRGEVGRLWIPLMPVLLVAAMVQDDPQRPSARDAVLVGALLAVSCLVLRVFWSVPL